MRRLPGAIAFALAATIAAGGCKDEEKRYVANAGPATPTMITEDVQTFISDSGYTRYHLSTELWAVYDDTTEPFWRFPRGLELEQYDNFKRLASTVVCDSAIYYSRKRLWQLDGNVVMVSTDGDSFLTQQLFWDQNTRRISSDSFIHIVRSDRILEGYGFESDQGMADYIIHNPTAILPAQRPGGKDQPDDTTQSDTPADSIRNRTTLQRPSERAQEKAAGQSQKPAKKVIPQAGSIKLNSQNKDAKARNN